MQTEEELRWCFWEEVMANIRKDNEKIPEVYDSKENYINTLDEIAIKNKVTSFGYTEMGYEIKASFNKNLGVGKNYELIVRGCGSGSHYIELYLLHENGSTFIINTFLYHIPYKAINDLLKTINNFDSLFHSRLIEFQKNKKLTQLTLSTIESLLVEKFKNTKYEWRVCESRSTDDSFLIEVSKNNNLVSMIVVDKSNFVQMIAEWKI